MLFLFGFISGLLFVISMISFNRIRTSHTISAELNEVEVALNASVALWGRLFSDLDILGSFPPFSIPQKPGELNPVDRNAALTDLGKEYYEDLRAVGSGDYGHLNPLQSCLLRISAYDDLFAKYEWEIARADRARIDEFANTKFLMTKYRQSKCYRGKRDN